MFTSEFEWQKMCLLQGSWVGQLPLATRECLIPDYCKDESFVKSLLPPSHQISFKIMTIAEVIFTALCTIIYFKVLNLSNCFGALRSVACYIWIGRFRLRCNCIFANRFPTPPFLTCWVENYTLGSLWWKLIISRDIKHPSWVFD